MSEFLSNSEQQPLDAYTERANELHLTLPWETPTEKQIAATRAYLEAEVAASEGRDPWEGLEDIPEETRAHLVPDALLKLTREVLADPVALERYASAQARYAKMEQILADEGLTPPERES